MRCSRSGTKCAAKTGVMNHTLERQDHTQHRLSDWELNHTLSRYTGKGVTKPVLLFGGPEMFALWIKWGPGAGNTCVFEGLSLLVNHTGVFPLNLFFPR